MIRAQRGLVEGLGQRRVAAQELAEKGTPALVGAAQAEAGHATVSAGSAAVATAVKPRQPEPAQFGDDDLDVPDFLK